MEMVARFYTPDGSLVNLMADADRKAGRVEGLGGGEVETLFEGSYDDAFEFFVGKGRSAKARPAAPQEAAVEQQIAEEVAAVETEEISEEVAMDPAPAADKRAVKGLFRKS